jgi:hypothetical protein
MGKFFHPSLGVVVTYPYYSDDLSKHMGPKAATPIEEYSKSWLFKKLHISATVDSGSLVFITALATMLCSDTGDLNMPTLHVVPL